MLARVTLHVGLGTASKRRRSALLLSAIAIQQYNAIGVSPSDFDGMFGAFHKTIAEQQGLDFRQTVDSVSVRMTIRRVK